MALAFTFCSQSFTVFGNENDDNSEQNFIELSRDVTQANEELRDTVFYETQVEGYDYVKLVTESNNDETYYTVRNDNKIAGKDVGVFATKTGKPGDTISLSVYSYFLNENIALAHSTSEIKLYEALNLDKTIDTASYEVPETNEGKKVESATLTMRLKNQINQYDLYKKDALEDEWQLVNIPKPEHETFGTWSDTSLTYVE